ncbi:protein yippee-like moh1 [Dispira simplex]|nr:protein yippee-like moh1 [Dispira simplex]
MGMKHKVYLDHSGQFYSCKRCETHLVPRKELVSKNFTGRHGYAYLFNKLHNVFDGPAVPRSMLTGEHIVCDQYCIGCGTVVGWKYVKAFVKTEAYKESKCILEMEIVSKHIF